MNRSGFLTSAGAVTAFGILPDGGLRVAELGEWEIVDGRNEEQFLTKATDTLGWIDGGRVSASFNGDHEETEIGLRLQYHDAENPETTTRVSIENKLEAGDGLTMMIGADLSVAQARALATVILARTEAVDDG